MYQKYKESDPRDTIRRIRDALASVGVHMDPAFMRPVDGIVSVRLTDREHGFETYGKGTDEDWALASAYGEAAERFQNRMAYEIPEPGPWAPFREWPDEQPVPLAEALRAPYIATDFGEHYSNGVLAPDAFLRELFGTDTVSLVPFSSEKQGGSVLLPDRIIGTLCGSNGLASGNTYDEALCQGMCEAAERYAKYRMLRDRVSPVTVPEEYIETEVPELFSVMKAIAEGSGCRVIIRDLKPASGFPVLQALLVDSVHQRYCTRFGCHPVFAVALERTLTELLQGQERLNALSNSVRWPQEQDVFSFRNLLDSVKTDIADLSDEFLSGVTDQNFTPWPRKPFTNRDGVRELTALFLRIAPDVLIRKTGFLGIPSVRIYIPGVTPLPLRFSDRILEYNRVSRLLHDPRYMTGISDESELQTIFTALTAEDSSVGNRIGQCEIGIGYDEMKGLLLYMLGQDENAEAAFEKSVSPQGKCMYHALRMKLAGKDDRIRKAVLQLFFGERTAAFTEKVLSDRKNALAVWTDPTGLYRRFLEMIPDRDSRTRLAVLEKNVRERMMADHVRRTSR